MQKFTDAYIRSLRPKKQRYVIREDAPRGEGGFCIRVTPAGSKSWYFVFTHPDRKNKGWCHLGDYPDVSLSKAREEFRKMRKLLADGKDPIVVSQGEWRERREAWTVDKLADEFLEKYANVKKSPRSAREDELNLARDIRRALGKVKARDVRRSDIVAMLDEIVSRGSGVQANRTLATVRKMFAWGLEREVVEVNPATGICKPTREVSKERALNLDEIRIFWHNLDAARVVPVGIRKALKLILLTGCRPGEVVGSQWEQVEGNWLNLPAALTKNKKGHRVYLSTLSRRIAGESGSGLIISKADGTPVPVYSLSFWLRRCNYFGVAQWSPHDLRRTCATRLAEMGTAPHLVQRILNHVQTGITGRVYDQHTYSDDIASALEQWSRKVERVVFSKTVADNIVPFRKR